MSTRTERLIRFYNRLRRSPVTIEIMLKWIKQAGIEISQRQLYRDLNELKSLNISKGENIIEFVDEQNRKTWKLEFDETQTAITQFDINTFFLIKNFIPSGIIEERKASFEKFEKVIYKELSQNKFQTNVEANEMYLKNTGYECYGYTNNEQILIDEIIWALQNKRTLIINNLYIDSTNVLKKNKDFPIKLYPMELLLHRGRVFMAGINKLTKKVMIISIENNLKITLTNLKFDRKKLETHYNNQIEFRWGVAEPIVNRIYTIKIEFTGSFGDSTKGFFWHKNGTWDKLENNNYLFTAKCFITRELIGWLAYGLDKVKVIQPLILQKLVAKKMQQTIDLYLHNQQPNEKLANADY